VNERKGDWMQTYTGRAFWPLDPRPDEIDIMDIAHGLGMACRYGGHTIRFYSVAEHCVHIANAAPDHLKLPALLHDASEAYLSDVIRPIKRHLAGYKAIEVELERCIAERFALPWPMPPEVKRLDEAIIADEKAQVMNPEPMPFPVTTWEAVEPLGVTIQFWKPAKAKFEFLTTFLRYGGKYG
jgi:uncharacterized protein